MNGHFLGDSALISSQHVARKPIEKHKQVVILPFQSNFKCSRYKSSYVTLLPIPSLKGHSCVYKHTLNTKDVKDK